MTATIIDCFGNWQVPPASDKQMRTADCIVAFSYGLDEGNQPGSTNEEEALIVSDLQRRWGLPLMLQWEVADCLPLKLRNHQIVRQHRIKGKDLDTREVAIQIAAELLRDPRYRPIVVAHPLHMWRCMKSLDQLGFQSMAADTKGVQCNPHSVQKWCRSPARFVPHEIAGRLLYLKNGWI